MSSKNISQKQSGFVSIIVAALIMIILSLITIGFTRVMQREQRQALDRQLTRQALYAAESGVNDIYTGILADSELPEEKPDCDLTSSLTGPSGARPNPAVNGGELKREDSGDVSVAYTCALYDKAPTVYNAVLSQSKVVELRTESGRDFETITFQWGNEQKGSPDNDISQLPACNSSAARELPSTRTNRIPVMQVDMTDTRTYSRSTLTNNTTALYLLPCRGAGGSAVTSFDIGPTEESGQIVSVRCEANVDDTPCSITFNVSNSPSFLFRMLPIYSNAQVRINGTEVGSRVAEFEDLQVMIDVTARAADIVRRLVVNVSLNNNIDDAPDAVFQSFNGVCKLVNVVENPSVSVVDGCNPPDASTTGGAVLSGTTSGPAPGAGNSLFVLDRCTVNPSGPSCPADGSPRPAPPPGTVYWAANFYNQADNNPAIVASCRWEFGDGTSTSGPASNPASACLYGQRMFKDYGPPTSPIVCRDVDVVLTVFFTPASGFSPAVYRDTRTVPGGPGAIGPGC